MKQQSPFKFLDSYSREDRAIFFGRDKETENIYDALSGVKHLLVYGPSGAGKTSLIECGLRNQFSDADWYALTIRRGSNLNQSVITAIREALNDDSGIDAKTDFGTAIEQLFAERFQPIYLLFDQFEELLISGDEAEKKEFFSRLYDLIRYKVPCRVILIMREEFIGHLSEYEKQCPSIFQHRFRLEKMGRKNVHTVISETLQSDLYKGKFSVENPDKLTDSILQKLPDNQREIELAHVQVFLNELWERAYTAQPDASPPHISQQLLKEEDNLQKVLDEFLKKQLAELDKQYDSPQHRHTTLEVLSTMISERHTKLQLSEQDILVGLDDKQVTLKKPLAGLLEDLRRRRILRVIKSGNETQYEISHDTLAKVVGDNLTEEMKLRERAKRMYESYKGHTELLAQQEINRISQYKEVYDYPPYIAQLIKDSERSIKVKNRTRIISLAAYGVVASLIAGVAIFFFFNAKEQTMLAEKQTKVAKDERKNAEEQTEIANKALLETEQEKERAETERANAEKQKGIAQEKTKLAEKQTEIAEREKTKAEVEKANAEEQTKIAQKALLETKQQKEVAETERANAEKQTKIAEGEKEKVETVQQQAEYEKRIALANDLAYKANDALDEKGDKNIAYRLSEIAEKYIQANNPQVYKILNKTAYDKDYPPVTQVQEIIVARNVNCVTFSFDRTKIALGQYGIVDIYDIQSGEFKEFKGHQSTVRDVEFSPDGQFLATASQDKTARVWDIQSEEFKEFKGHQGGVIDVEFSPDGQFITTASVDKTARVWDIQSGQFKEFKGHQSTVLDIEFSPNGKSIATISLDKTARVWDIQSGQFKELKGHQEYVRRIEFSPDGKSIGTASEDKTARVWDIQSGQFKEFKGHQEYVRDIEFSPDGQFIGTASEDKTARIWDIQSGEFKEFRGHQAQVYNIEFSPDGKSIATSSSDKTTRVWNIQSRQFKEFKGHHGYIEFSPDSKSIIATYYDYDKTGGTLGVRSKLFRVLDIQNKEFNKFKGHQSVVKDVEFSPDGQFIATASHDKTARVWDIQSGQFKEFKGHQDYLKDIEFSPDGQFIATASHDKTSRVWDIQSGQFKEFKGHQDYVIDIEFSPNGKSIATASKDKTSRVWDIQSGQFKEFKGHQGGVIDVEFSPDGQFVATTSGDKTARVWDIQSGQFKEFKGHQEYVRHIEFSPDGQFIATTSGDRTARVWDIQSGEFKEFRGHQFDVWDIKFSPDGKSIATSSSDKTARVWDIQSGQFKEFKGHQGFVRDVEFSPDGQFIATCEWSTTARVWDIQSGQFKEFKGHQGHVYDIEFSPDGQSVATISADRTARVYHLESKAILTMLHNKNMPIIPTNFIEEYGIAEILEEAGEWDNFFNDTNEHYVLYHFGKYYEEKVNSTFNPDTRQAYLQKAKACYRKAYELSGYGLYRRLGGIGRPR